jgi:peroxiredoxin Q/BCP
MKLNKIIALGALAMASFSLLALTAGEDAPNFTAKNQDGKTISLADYKGKPVLLYFYPMDETPGCTKEACSFRDAFSELKKEGAVVLGVSTQDSESHRKFKANHKLPFDLISDLDGSLAKLYGVTKVPLVGVYHRESILIDPNGKVFKFYGDVDPSTHTQEVISDIAKMPKAS